MVERLERCPDPSRLRDTEICNTFITPLPCKNAVHLLPRMQAGGQRGRREGETEGEADRDREREVGNIKGEGDRETVERRRD